MLVERHTVELALAEVVHLLLVVGLDPACLMDLDRLVAALGAVFVLQTVLDDLELQGSDRADDLAPVHPAREQLRDAFVHQLVDTLGQLLELHRIGVLDVAEQLGREARNAGESQRLAFGEGVADLKVTRVVQPDDVAGVCLVDHRFFLGHEGRGRRELDRFARRHVQVGLVALEATRADFQKRDPVAVVRVHVRMDLEHESGQFLLVGRHVALERMRLAGRRRDMDEAVEQLADSEIVQCAAEKDRRDLALAVAVEFERRINAFDELQIVRPYQEL